ncbi:prolyl endopeptidase-like isoform X2 [Pleurodeles waltl]|uniref:prolyl endopeptidase-like isoform X2 n=1 Tax=Pleurodeles waltl TaxID=8319 RepID=UPI003709B299
MTHSAELIITEFSLSAFWNLTAMNQSMKCFLQTLHNHARQWKTIQIPVNYFSSCVIQSKYLLKTTFLENNLSHLNVLPNSRVTRSFSWQDQAKLERDRWKTFAAQYLDEAAHFHQRLERIYKQYSDSFEPSLIKISDFTYFEEEGGIFRARQNDGHVENVLLLEDLDFSVGHIQRIRISPDQERLAASVTVGDSEEARCIIVNLLKLQHIECVIPNVFSFEWTTNSILFYTEQKDVRCSRVFLCDLTEGNCTQLVYTETNPRFFVDICCTRDKKYLSINSNSKTSSEVWLVDCHRPLDPPFLVQQRTAGVIYHVEHWNNTLYILTTLGENSEYKLMKTPMDSRTLDKWKLVYTVKEKLVDMEMMKDHCIMFLKQSNVHYLTVISLASETVVYSTQLPAWACAFESESLCGSGSSSLGFKLSSPVQQPVRFVYSLAANELFVEAYQDVQNTSHLCTVRLEAESKDGSLVPITLFHKPCQKLKDSPLLVHVYGAYGIDLSMTFKPERLLLLEEGWILAYCHVRGGGELGNRWHEEGRLENKLNGLDDLNACVTQLHKLGYSEPGLTALTAASAGGVLAGAMCNHYPDLIRAVVLQAPFLDVFNTMLDANLPLTLEEQEEWGNPLSSEKYMEYIKSYCPYQNIKLQNYPSVLITVNENDQRIPLRGLLRYVVRLRKAVADYFASSNEGPRISNIVLHIQPGGSHCSSPPWEDSLNEVAEQYAFLYKELGLRNRSKSAINDS